MDHPPTSLTRLAIALATCVAATAYAQTQRPVAPIVDKALVDGGRTTARKRHR
ncbi:MAG: hypothetical protein ABL931_06780 [Usitatibacteraceae bacterium]